MFSLKTIKLGIFWVHRIVLIKLHIYTGSHGSMQCRLPRVCEICTLSQNRESPTSGVKSCLSNPRYDTSCRFSFAVAFTTHRELRSFNLSRKWDGQGYPCPGVLLSLLGSRSAAAFLWVTESYILTVISL